MRFSCDESDYVKFEKIFEFPDGSLVAIFESRTVPIGTGNKVQTGLLSASGRFQKGVTVPVETLEDRLRIIEVEQEGTAGETRKALSALARHLG